MKERLISCVDAAVQARLNRADEALLQQIARAKTPSALRAIVSKLRIRLRVAEGTVAQQASRIVVLKQEGRVLSKSRENHKRAIRILAAEIGRTSPEGRADDIARDYDPNRIPF